MRCCKAQSQALQVSAGSNKKLLRPSITMSTTGLVVVCDSEGIALGVVSGADIVNAEAHRRFSAWVVW
jgi:hypothetical protein